MVKSCSDSIFRVNNKNASCFIAADNRGYQGNTFLTSQKHMLWVLIKPNLQCLQRNDRAMIRQICNVKLQDTVTTRSNELLARLGIEDLDLILKERRLRWYGHVECSNGAVKTAFDIAWAWEVQYDMKAADRKGLQIMEALSYRTS